MQRIPPQDDSHPTEAPPAASNSRESTDSEIEMEVFRAGDYGAKGHWSEAELDQLARDYDPQLLEAPLTFDHARRGPAYGWVVALRRAGDRLLARVKDVPEVVRELLRRGAYKKRSVEILRQWSVTGRPYLRAVSLLGAASPAVPGLREVCFDADEDSVALDSTEGELEQLRREVARLREQLSRARRDQGRRRALDVVAAARARGVSVAPAEADLVAAFSETFADSDTVIKFGDEELDPLDWLAHLYGVRTPELPAGVAAPSQVPATAGWLGEATERTDPISFQLHQRAMTLLAEDPALSYAAALSRAARGMSGRPHPAPPSTPLDTIHRSSSQGE